MRRFRATSGGRCVVMRSTVPLPDAGRARVQSLVRARAGRQRALRMRRRTSPASHRGAGRRDGGEASRSCSGSSATLSRSAKPSRSACRSSAGYRPVSRSSARVEERHRAAAEHARGVLGAVLEDLLHRAGAAGREHDAGRGDGQQAVLADAVREVLRDVGGEQADRLARGHPRGDRQAVAARREARAEVVRDAPCSRPGPRARAARRRARPRRRRARRPSGRRGRRRGSRPP